MLDAKFNLVFDEVILKQLRKAGEDAGLRALLSKSFDKLEVLGPRAGKLLDSKLFLYELKIKRPPIRIYFKPIVETGELYVFEFQMKTSDKSQREIIEKLRIREKSKS